MTGLRYLDSYDTSPSLVREAQTSCPGESSNIHVLHALIASSAAASSVRFACTRTYLDLRLGHRARRIIEAGHTNRRRRRGFTFACGKRCLRALGDVPTRHCTEPGLKTAREEPVGRLWNNRRGSRISSILSHVRKRRADEARLRGRAGNGPRHWTARRRATGY